LATSAGDDKATVWEADTGRELISLPTDHYRADRLAWSSDGKRLAAAGGGMVRVYAMDVPLLVSLARSRATRNFTGEECRKYLHVDEVPPIPFG
jgi:WD40 repeat protein